MNHVHRAGRSPASLTRLAGMPLACRAAEPAVAAATRPGPSRPATHSPLPAPARTITTSKPRAGARPGPPRERLRTTVLPARLPHTIQLRVHCRDTRPGSGSAAPAARQRAGPGACPAARHWTVTAAM